MTTTRQFVEASLGAASHFYEESMSGGPTRVLEISPLPTAFRSESNRPIRDRPGRFNESGLPIKLVTAAIPTKPLQAARLNEAGQEPM